MIVLDANILIRAILGRRVRQLIETYSLLGVRLYTPDIAFEDARKYLPPLLEKRVSPILIYPWHSSIYGRALSRSYRELYGIFEKEARQRLRGRDETDWPVLATALGLACPVWTEDPDFFGTGIAVWTTSRIEIFFKAQTK